MTRKELYKSHSPIMVSRPLATKIGLNKAIVVCHINYLCCLNELHGKFYEDGNYWVRRSVDDWVRKDFIWWSYATVGKLLRELEREGLIISKARNTDIFDRTKWYRVNYEALPDLKNEESFY